MQQEDGAALVTTIGVTMVVTLLVTAVLASTTTVLRQTRRDVSWHTAIGAAQAGVEDYLARLNADPDYWQRSPTNPDGTANPLADQDNAAFWGFTPVPGATNGATYTYQVEQDVRQGGGITITSTGAVDGVARTVRSGLRRASFLDYLYLDEYQTRDPEQYITWPSLDEDNEDGDRDGEVENILYGQAAVTEAALQCSHHRYDRTRGTTPEPGVTFWDGRHPDCYEPHWTADRFYGSFHSNDMVSIRESQPGEPLFTGPAATTSWSDGAGGVPGRSFLDVRIDVNGRSTGAAPDFPYPPEDPSVPAVKRLRYHERIALPPDNLDLRDQALAGGYVFTGPTRLVLADDQIVVNSPGSGSAYGLSGGVGTLPLPGNGAVYVQDGESQDCTGFRPPLGAQPGAEDYLTAMYPADPVEHDISSYSCYLGDAYVEGRLRGRLTIGAQHDIFLTWHIGYESSPTDSATFSGYRAPPAPPTSDRDLLGLVAQGGVRIFRPLQCLQYLVADGVTTSACIHGRNILFRTGSRSGTVTGLVVYASILATRRSLRTDNSAIGGGTGDLFVFGSIAQQFRGALGSASGITLQPGSPGVPSDCRSTYVDNGRTVVTSSWSGSRCISNGGFRKSFSYDERLRYLTPPSFLQPASVSWGASSFEERSVPAGLTPPG